MLISIARPLHAAPLERGLHDVLGGGLDGAAPDRQAARDEVRLPHAVSVLGEVLRGVFDDVAFFAAWGQSFRVAQHRSPSVMGAILVQVHRSAAIAVPSARFLRVAEDRCGSSRRPAGGLGGRHARTSNRGDGCGGSAPIFTHPCGRSIPHRSTSFGSRLPKLGLRWPRCSSRRTTQHACSQEVEVGRAGEI